MDKDETLKKIAYEMINAYERESTMTEAIYAVGGMYDVNYDVLAGMWLAIDAYIDLNEMM